MSFIINITASSSDEVTIDGEVFRERNEMAAALKRMLSSKDDYTLIIDVQNSEDSYRGIGRFLYATQIAGVATENLRYKIDANTLLTFNEMQKRFPRA